MARPEQNNVEYFPFLCKEGKAMYYIETKYGNDGYATWIKILRQLAVTNYHYLNLNNDADLMFLSSKCKVSESILSNIISDLCKLGEFDNELWIDNKIVFSEKFIESIKDAYSKRKNNCIHKQGLLLLLSSLGIRKPILKDEIDTNNTQSIVEYSKVKKSKVLRTFIPPLISDCILFFTENGYTKESAEKAFNYYNDANWVDSKGNKVLSWKQKMRGVWFKDENKNQLEIKRTIVY